MSSTLQEPKFHISVASFLYRDNIAANVIVEVPNTAEKKDADKDSRGSSNIYQFTSKYCSYDSSDDEDTTNANVKDKKVDSKSSSNSDNHSNSNNSGGPKSDSNIRTNCFSDVDSISTHHNDDACSEILSCNIIECLIGNRIFRCSIDIDNKLSSSLEFKEIFTNHSTKKQRNA
jgi:hypothetical protein